MKLSILVPTMPERREHFDKLMAQVVKQLGPSLVLDEQKLTCSTKGVEMLWCRTPATADGGPILGDKRQWLLEQSSGDFVAFVDDDDELHPEYIDRILEGCREGIDCIGFEVECYGYAGPGEMELANVSNRYQSWQTDNDGYRYTRCPHHLAPIRREHALAAGFKTIQHGEDADYSMRLRDLGVLKNEWYIKMPIYIYWFDGKKRPH